MKGYFKLIKVKTEVYQNRKEASYLVMVPSFERQHIRHKADKSQASHLQHLNVNDMAVDLREQTHQEHTVL